MIPVAWDRRRTLTVVAVLVAVLLVSQALGALTAPPATATGAAGTAEGVGRAGFAYLGGLRRFAAAVLWNRLEPQFHGYYEGIPLTEQDYIIPTLALVQALDPQFERAYFLSSWFIYRRIGEAQGIDVARRGLEANPRSGLLKANLAQLLFLQDAQKNLPDALELANSALTPETVWSDNEDRFEGYAVFRDIYRAAGQEGVAADLEAIMERMQADGIGEGDHDHDGDGEQDH